MSRTAVQTETAGRALKRIFRQDDIFGRIEEQPASISMFMNPTRLGIFIHLCQNPCLHTRSIARTVDASLTTVNWHLGQLLESGYLESKMLSRKKLYWPRGMLDPRDAEMIGCLRHAIPPGILRSIHQNPGVRQAMIVENMHLKQQNVDFWLRKMVKCRMIERHGRGMGTTFDISETLAKKIPQYDSKARPFSRHILELLYNDGLMPSEPRLRGTRLGVNVNVPSGKRRIHLECSPMADARRLLG